MEDPGQPVAVTVLDETGSQPDVERWSSLVAAALTDEGVAGPAETNVVFVEPQVIAELNAEHLGGSGPTDVLSFPIDDATDPGELRLVGDIVVCPQVAAANAPGHAGDVDDEIALLLVHGVLHLLGHDHADSQDREVMWAAERRLLAAHWRPLAADPWAAVAAEETHS